MALARYLKQQGFDVRVLVYGLMVARDDLEPLLDKTLEAAGNFLTEEFKGELSGVNLVVARKPMETAGVDAWLAKARLARGTPSEPLATVSRFF